jgi:hypothetical protein
MKRPTLEEQIEQLRSMKKTKMETEKEKPKSSTIHTIQSDVTKYTKKFQKLLELEYKEDLARLNEQLKRPRDSLKDDGSVLFDLMSDTNGQLRATGKTLVKFQLREGRLPTNSFAIGDSVVLSKIDPIKENFKGIVVYCNPYMIRCAMESWSLDFSIKLWRMDRGISEISQDRMKIAMADMLEDPNQKNMHLPKKNYPKGSYLTGIITATGIDSSQLVEMASEKVGLFVPTKEQMTEWKTKSLLNLSQQIAIERSLNRRLSLILGPPGCKTI